MVNGWRSHLNVQHEAVERDLVAPSIPLREAHRVQDLVGALWQDAKTKNAESDQLTSSVVKTSTRPAAGGHGLFSAAKTLSTSGWLAGGPEAGALTDRTIAAWGESAKTKPSRLRIAIRSKGNWTVASPRKAPDLDTNSVSLAAGSKHVTVVWIQHPDAKRPGGQAYLARYRPS